MKAGTYAKKLTRCYINELTDRQYINLLSWLDERSLKYSIEKTYDCDRILYVYKDVVDKYDYWEIPTRDSCTQNEVATFWFDIKGRNNI